MVTVEINGVDKTSDIQHSTFGWEDNLTNRVNTLSFSIIGETLPFTLALDDEVVVKVGGDPVFGGRVITLEDTVQASSLKTRTAKCKDFTVDMDDHYYTAIFEEERELYVLIRDLLHTINRDYETTLAEFETIETWTGGSADTTNYRRGSQGRKVTSSGSYATSEYTPSTAINVSDEEYIVFDAYVDDASVCDAIRLRLGDSSLTNYYEYEITSGFETGWNYYRVLKTAFSSTGSPAWSAIAKIQVGADATASNTVNVTFDDLYAMDEDGFTMDNVVTNNLTIPSAKFGFKLPSDVLKRYAQVTAYEWYVDANRDIHFFSSLQNGAPFELTDDGGNHIYDSLKIDQDLTKLRNVVLFFGGQETALNNTTEYLGYQADGTQTNFQVARKYNPTTVSVEVNSVAQTVGIEGEDDIASVDVLYNQDDNSLFFASAPTGGVDVNLTGKRVNDLQAKFYDASSISLYGEKEIVIKEEDITTRDAAIKRSFAEFSAYASQIVDATFETDSQGLRAGQRIHLNLASLGIDEYYIVQRVSGRMRTEDDMTFSVQLVSTRNYSLVHVLQMLLADRLKGIDEYNSDSLIGGTFDIVEVSDVVVATNGDEEVVEVVSIGDSIEYWLQTAGEGGDPFSYVAGNYEPSSNSDTTRTPCADGGGTAS